MRFELTRAKPSRFLVYRLNHSATLSQELTLGFEPRAYCLRSRCSTTELRKLPRLLQLTLTITNTVVGFPAAQCADCLGEKQKRKPLARLELATSGLEVLRAIHCATGACVNKD